VEDLAGAFRLVSGASVLVEVIQGTVEVRSEDVDGALLRGLGRAASFPDAPGFRSDFPSLYGGAGRGGHSTVKRGENCATFVEEWKMRWESLCGGIGSCGG